MNKKLQQLFEHIMPFIMIGMAMALLIGLLFVFSYVLVWGFLIGGLLWIITAAKQYLFPNDTSRKEEGRIIEHDDKK